MIQIGAGQTRRAFLSDKRDPGFGSEIFFALGAGRFAIGDEDLEFFGVVRLRGHKRFQKSHGLFISFQRCCNYAAGSVTRRLAAAHPR